ncbi:GAF domain-containing sensor histidine kinase [Synechocystis sp. LKSZ1]|uniref:GAF domain-containing sensor histidine kinase n=1 Tax=Synechocystis sp. LKSZ1 TaxID=3144951 RepID=UPI00336BE5A5
MVSINYCGPEVPMLESLTAASPSSPRMFSAPSLLTSEVRQSRQLEHDLIQLLNQKSPGPELLLQIAESLGQALGAEICLLILGTVGTSARLVCWTPQDCSQQFLPPVWGQSAWVQAILRSMEPVFFLSQGPDASALAEDGWDLPLHSGLGLAITFQGDCNGMIILGSSQIRDWSLADAHLLEELKDCLGLIYHVLQSQGARTTSLPRSLASEDNAIVKRWYEATRQQLEQQRQWNEQLIHNIVTIMSDQTRNPLATIRVGLEILRQGTTKPAALSKRLDIIEQAWRKLNEINEKILQLRALKNQPLGHPLQPLALIPWLTDLVQTTEQAWRATSSKNLALTTDLPAVEGQCLVDRDHLQRIFEELLTNAEKFAPPHSPVHLTAAWVERQGQKYWKIQCINQSHCLTSKNLRYLFDPFYREQWVIDNAIPGLGLGLSIVKTLVEQLNGTIEVACEPTTTPELCAVTFSLMIPQDNAVS